MPELNAARRCGLVVLVLLAACSRSETVPRGVAVGDARHGARLISATGCGACHTIPGISGAHGLVGPPLTAMGRRTMVAGLLPNTPENLVHWLRAPQSVAPGNAMPDMGLDDRDAHDIAAYLYSLR
jgi:cytochrome c2